MIYLVKNGQIIGKSELMQQGFEVATEKLNEINSVSEDNEYFNDQNEPMSALEYLHNIDLNLL